MNTYTGTIGKLVKIEINSNLHLPTLNIFSKQHIDMFLGLIGRLLEYLLGIHLGGVIGYVFGRYAGSFYVNYFTSINHTDLEVNNLWQLSYIFGFYGAIIGAVIGALVITALIVKKSSAKNEKEGGAAMG